MALEISGNKENLSLSWETFLQFNILNDEVKTRQDSTLYILSLVPYVTWAVISKMWSVEYVAMTSQRYWTALNAICSNKTLCIVVHSGFLRLKICVSTAADSWSQPAFSPDEVSAACSLYVSSSIMVLNLINHSVF